MQLSWSTAHAAAGVVLVRCRLHNDGETPRRGRLRCRLAGPVLPPRRREVPRPGFDADGVDVRLAPGERRGVGFAVVLDAPPDGDDAGAARGAKNAKNAENGPADPPVELVDVKPAATRDDGRPDDDLAHGDGGRSPVGPARVDGWLDAVERRVERGERLSDADAATAAEVLAAAGGAAALDDLDERLAGDAERLRRVGERATALAKRAEAADPPTDALERLR